MQEGMRDGTEEEIQHGADRIKTGTLEEQWIQFLNVARGVDQ